MSLSTPDAVGELVGLRAWRVQGGALWSLYRPLLWRPDVIVEARCLTADPSRPARRTHRAPMPGCRCGLYAARRPSETGGRDPNTCSGLSRLLGLGKAPNVEIVYGEVAGWGVAEVGEKAWRAQFCRPRAIYDTHPDAGLMADLYDVPLVALEVRL